jgi:hypothetical protein
MIVGYGSFPDHLEIRSVPEGDSYSIETRSDSVTFQDLYQSIGLESDLSYKTFQRAMTGYQNLSFRNKDIITIIDYTKPSTEERLFIIDLKNNEILYKSLVAHGKNTGLNLAQEFSNASGSLKSSPGFYSTAETYFGKHGYSLRLDGQEPAINDKARQRAIVIHGANYVSQKFIEKHHRLGRSWGCPALPLLQTKEIIDLIKGGTCLYIHTDDQNYLKNSVISE